MLRPPLLHLLAVFAALSQSGCAVWMLPGAEVQVHHDYSQELTAAQAMSPVMRIEGGDIGQIEVGQYAKIWTANPIDSTESTIRPRIVAGRVLAMNADEVVLSECVGFEEPITRRPEPLVNKIPLVNRLFKVTGVGVTPTPISGEVRLRKSSVVGAYLIPQSEWDSFHQQPHFERVGALGVDFDFNDHR